MSMWNRARATVTCTFCRPHFPKQLRTFQLLTMFMWSRFLTTVSCAFVLWDPQIFQFLCDIPLSLQSFTHFANPIFLRILFDMEFSLYSLVHILPTSSLKSDPNLTVAFNMFKCKSSSRNSPVHFLSAACAVRGTGGNRDPTLVTTEASLPRNTVSREIFVKPEFTRSRPVTLPNYMNMMMMMMMMMMMITSACGWCDGENAGHDNRP